MVKLTTISIKDEIITNPKYKTLIRERKLSETINQLLKAHLNVIDEDTNKSIQEIQDKLEEVTVKRAIYQDKLDKLEAEAREKKKKEEAEAKKWRVIRRFD